MTQDFEADGVGEDADALVEARDSKLALRESLNVQRRGDVKGVERSASSEAIVLPNPLGDVRKILVEGKGLLIGVEAL